MTVDGEAWRTRSPTSRLAAVALGAIVVAAPLDGALAQDIDPDIKLSVGGQYGREELRENLRDEAY